MLAAVEFMKDSSSRIPFDASDAVGQKVVAEARKRGLIARALPHGDILGFAPPLCATCSDITDIVQITVDAVQAVSNVLQPA
jgi:L-2,4-diaminobutyrate transaminase